MIEDGLESFDNVLANFGNPENDLANCIYSFARMTK